MTTQATPTNLTDGSAVYRLVASPWNYWIGFGLDVALGVVLTCLGLLHRSIDLSTVAAALAGWVFFTFIEYAIHRWGYHGLDSPLTYVHRFHHADGDTLVGAPFFYPLVIITVVIGVAQLFLPLPLVAVFAGAVLIAYEAQTLIHAIAHAWPGARDIRKSSTGRIPLIRRLRRHHMIHHAGDGNVNFGMSTTIWDRLFGTYAAKVRGRSSFDRVGGRSSFDRIAVRQDRGLPSIATCSGLSSSASTPSSTVTSIG